MRSIALSSGLRRLPVRGLLLGTLLGGPALSLGAPPAFAQSAARRVGHYAEGADAKALQSELAAALPASSDDTNEQVRKGLAKRGLVGKIERHLSPAARRKALDGALLAVARELQLDAVLVVVGRKKDAVLIGVALDGSSVVDTTVAQGSGRAGTLKEAIKQAGLGAPAEAPPPAPSRSAPTSDDPPPASERPPASRAQPAPSSGLPPRSLPLVTFALGGEASLRRLRYNDPFSTNLRPYDVTGAPSLAAAISLAPLSRTYIPILRRLELFSTFATSLGLQSGQPGGGDLATTFRRWRAGGRLSAPIGEGTSAIGLEGTYGQWSFLFDGSSSMELPDVEYQILRGGLDFRLDAGSVVLLAGGGYGKVNEVGPMSVRFPRLTAGVVDARLGLAIPIVSKLEARVWGDYTRFFFTMNPEPGDRFVAGGALDQYVTVHLDAAFSL